MKSLVFPANPPLLGHQYVPSRVAFVTSTPFNVAGGSGTYVGISQLARALRDRNIRVELLLPACWSPSFTLKRILFNLSIARRLRRARYDWVVGYDLDGFHYGRAKSAPYVASIKGVIADELTNERGITRAMLRIQAALERLAVHRADVVVATSQYSRSRIVETYGIPGEKIIVVPELIDLRLWEEEDLGVAEIESDPPAILTVAHMYPRKNLGILMEAYARLRDAGISFQGWVVGEGPCRRTWEHRRDSLDLGKRITFFGTIPRRALVDRYRRAAIFCLSSQQEGFGIVFLEAMAFGKPVVATRVSAIPETVVDGETGLLVDPNDAEALARALAALLSDPSRRRALGAEGRRQVERFRADRVGEAFLLGVQAALSGLPGPHGRTHFAAKVSLATDELRPDTVCVRGAR